MADYNHDEIKKKALIIGISRYDNPRLPTMDFVKSEAEGLCETLKSIGFKVEEKYKLTEKVEWLKARDSIYDFFGPNNVRPDDLLVFYFSGHGLIDNSRRHYLATTDIELEQPDMRGFSISDLVNIIQKPETQFTKIVMILDCCYGADPKETDKVEATKIANHYISQAGISTNGKYIFSAVQPYQKAIGDKIRGSLFTRYLIKGLAGAGGDAVDDAGNVTLFQLHKYIQISFDTVKPKPKQIPLIGKISPGSDNGKDIVFVTYSTYAEIQAQKADVERIVGVEQIQKYYNIDPERIIPIRCSELKAIKKWVMDWRPGDPTKKPILLITGDPGTGKSWLSYLLISELMREEFVIYSVIGSDIRRKLVKKIEASSVNSAKEPVPIFILDDKGMSITEANRPITAEDIYNIVKDVLPNSSDESYVGPLIISMREETWNYIVNGGKTNTKIADYQLEKLVEKIELGKLDYNESSKLVTSFYSNTGNGKPLLRNLQVNDEIKNQIIEKSKGNPLIIWFFFNELRIRFADQPHIVTLEETNQIISNSKHYALKLIFSYYFQYMDNPDKVANGLAFLFFISTKSVVSIGTILRLREELTDYFSDDIRQYLSLLNYERSIPLFNIDKLGTIIPFHDNVIEAIDILLKNPSKLAQDLEDHEEIIDKVRRVADIDFEIDIKERASNDFISPYENFVMKSMDYYLEKCTWELDNSESISDITLYNSLSIFIEIIRPESKFNPKWVDKYTKDLELILKRYKLHNGKLESNISEQIFFVAQAVGWFKSQSIANKDLLLFLLATNNINVRIETWSLISELIQAKVLSLEDLDPYKKKFLDLLTIEDRQMVQDAWSWAMPEVLKIGLVTREDENFMFLLMQSENQIVRANAWSILEILVNNEVVDPNPINKIKGKFMELLADPDGQVSSISWNTTPYLINNGVILAEDIKPLKIKLLEKLQDAADDPAGSDIWSLIWSSDNLLDAEVITPQDRGIFIQLMKNPNEQLRSKAWQTVPSLLDKRILEVQHVRELKGYFFDLLKSQDLNIKWDNWLGLGPLISLVSSRVLELGDLAPLKQHFFEFLSTPDFELRRSVWGWSLTKLIKQGIFTSNEIAQERRHLFQILKEGTEEDKIDAWSFAILPLIEVGVLDSNELKQYKAYFLPLLENADTYARNECWNLVPDLIKHDLLLEEDIMKKKQYFLDLLRVPEDITDAWGSTLKNLADEKIVRINGPLPLKDIEQEKQYFLNLLKSSDEELRKDAWTFVKDLIELMIITKDDITPSMRYFLQLLTSQDVEIRWEPFGVVLPVLIDLGLISKVEICSRKKYFFALLKHSAGGIRLTSWSSILYLVKIGFLKAEELEQVKDKFIELLSKEQYADTVRDQALTKIQDMIEYKIFTALELGKFKTM